MRKPALRAEQFAGAVFFELTALKNEVAQTGRPMVDLSIGSPDTPPPPHVIETLRTALASENAFGYSRTEGTLLFRSAASAFLANRYGVSANPETEILTLMGSQDGLSHLPLAIVNPGDIVLIPDPGYPIYEVSVHLAGGIPYPLPLLEENGYLPDFRNIPDEIAAKASMLILNYPSNPLATVASGAFFDEAIAFATKHRLAVVHDAAYAELVFDGYTAPSFLSRPGAKEVGIELHTLSKTFNFAGPRLAFAAGNRELLAALAKVKSNIDYGVFAPVQAAGAAAMRDDRGHIDAMRKLYAERRDALIAGMAQSGWEVSKPSATMFVWAKIPTNEDSRTFCARVLRQTGVVCVPGVGFGRVGEGCIRIALVQPAEVLTQAGQMLGEAALSLHPAT